MKKKLMASLLCIGMVGMLVTGCGKGKVEKAEGLKKLAPYEGLEVYKSKTVVTDASVEEQLKGAAEQYATTKNVTEGTVKDKDVVNIDYVGKIDGKEFDKGAAKGQDLTIGSKSFIDNFEEQLIGKKVGSKSTINVTFPDPYENDPTKAGKKATFDVTINHIVEKVIPEVTDAFIAEKFGYSECKTVAEFKEFIRNKMKQSNIMAAIWTDYLAKCEVETYPADELKEMETQVNSYYESQIYQQYQVNLEDYLKGMNQTQADWDKNVKEVAQNAVKEKLVIKAIAKEKGWTVEEADYKKEINNYMEQQTYGSQEEVESAVGKDTIEYNLLSNKVLEYIVSKVKVVEDPPETTTVPETTTAASETTKEDTTTK